MHTKTMEGLIGARTNMNMSSVPMRVYNEARRKKDTAKMERALGYVGDFMSKASEYQSTAEEGMKADAAITKEKEKIRQEEAIEKNRAENKEHQQQIESIANEQLTDEAVQVDLNSSIDFDTTVKINPDVNTHSAVYNVTGTVNVSNPSSSVSVTI